MAALLGIAVLFLGVAALGWWLFRWQYRRAHEILHRWAVDNSLELLEIAKANPYGTGPIAAYAGNKQVVFRIRVRDGMGHVRHGTARVGSPATGTVSNRIEVEWDT